MGIFDWKEEYSVKIKEIDNQHKILVEMVNEMHDAMTQGKGKEVLGPILEELIQYTKTHFANEERLMEKYDYPDFAPHRNKHKKMTAKVLSLQEDYQQGKFQLSFEVSKFLQDWLTKHILGTDMKYSDFLISRGAE